MNKNKNSERIKRRKQHAKTKKVKKPLDKKNDREMDDLFAGWEGLKKLQRGTVLEDESEHSTFAEPSTEQSDDEDSEEICFPASWVKIASNDKATQDKMMETLLRESKSKKKGLKKHCNPKGGNPNHSKEDGRFSSRSSKGSWSIRTDKTGPDCDAGTYRKTGGNKKVWVKQPCGRDSDVNLCGTKDGVRAGRKIKESESELASIDSGSFEDQQDVKLNMQLSDRLDKIKDRSPDFVKHLAFLVKPIIDLEQRDNSHFDDEQRDNSLSKRTELEQSLDERKRKSKKKSPFQGYSADEIRQSCKTRYNLMTFEEFLQLLNRIEAARGGKLGGDS